MGNPRRPKTKKCDKMDKVDTEIAEITQSLTRKVQTIIEHRVTAATKKMENQINQLRKELSDVRTRRATETRTLKDERDIARAKLNQTKQQLATITTERDALVKRVRNGHT